MKMSLIVLCGLAVSLLLRHRSAAMRHWVLAAAVVCAAAVPLLEAIVPAWPLPFAAPAPFERYEASGQNQMAGPQAPRQNSPRRDSLPQAPTTGTSVEPFNAAGALQQMWILGAVIGLGILLVGVLRLAWLATRAHAVTHGQWRDLADEISMAYGLRRPVSLLQSAHPSLLVTWGLASPKVILPAGAGSWSAARARVVLAHELAHIKRGDWIVQLSAELLRALYWFNPLLWITCRALRLESEHACDDEVMSGGVEGSEYATHLVELARALNAGRQSWFPAPAMARPSSLERRVRAMLNDRLTRTPITGTARAAIFAVLLAMTAVVAAAQSGFMRLSGSVTDETGRGIAGTTLTLTNDQRQMKYEVKTNESGRYEFIGLPSGDYGLEARGMGFGILRDTITVAGQNLQRNLTLKLGMLRETINVAIDDRVSSDAPVGSNAPVVKEVPMPARRECVASPAGGRIVPPRKIRDVRAQYPTALRGSGTEGIVRMEGRIGLDGYVGDIRVIGDAQPDLAQAAIAAVREWRFTETLLNCTPTEVMMAIAVNFARIPPPPSGRP